MSVSPEYWKESPTRFHRELDVEKYAAFWDECRIEMESRHDHLSGITASQIQELFSTRASYDTKAGIPTDSFFLLHGEAPDRSMTKVGGLPYWPADRPWPTNPRGKPLSFMCQVNFRDSRDLLPELPADILVVFVGSFSPRGYWVHFDEGRPLITMEQIPAQPRIFSEGYGVVHRTYDHFDWYATLQSLPTTVRILFGVTNELKVGGEPWNNSKRLRARRPFLFSSGVLAEEVTDEDSECFDGACCSDNEDVDGSYHCIRFEFIRRFAFLNRSGRIKWRWKSTAFES